MTREERDRLRALAKRAAEGPWEASRPNLQASDVIARRGTDYLIVCEFAGDDADYIAAADPPTVLGLLDALDATEARGEALRAALWAADEILPRSPDDAASIIGAAIADDEECHGPPVKQDREP